MKKILVAIDGSKNSLDSLQSGREMAEKFGAQLLVINVQKAESCDAPDVPVCEHPDTLKARGQKVIDKGLETIKGTPVDVKSFVVIGDPAEQIVHHAEKEDVDIVLMGSQGLSGIRRFLIGSVSNKVLHHSPKPVMVMK